MTLHVPARYDERLTRLALGLEPLDTLRRSRIARRLEVAVDDFPVPARRTPLARHPSCVHVLVHPREPLSGTLELRCLDASRHYVPRRLRVQVATDAATRLSPGFLPGASYDISPSTTGLRGRVLRGDQPMRWVRVEARLASPTPGGGPLVGHAHGDDRGEFLLLLEPAASTLSAALPSALEVEVSLYGPPTPPTPDSPEQPGEDPLWDLPVEPLPGPEPDRVTPGLAIPSEYGTTPGSRTVVSLPLGRLTSPPDAFTFP